MPGLEQGQLLSMDSIALKQKVKQWRQRISAIRQEGLPGPTDLPSGLEGPPTKILKD